MNNIISIRVLVCYHLYAIDDFPQADRFIPLCRRKSIDALG
jgi:hypothetical protein